MCLLRGCLLLRSNVSAVEAMTQKSTCQRGQLIIVRGARSCAHHSQLLQHSMHEQLARQVSLSTSSTWVDKISGATKQLRLMLASLVLAVQCSCACGPIRAAHSVCPCHPQPYTLALPAGCPGFHAWHAGPGGALGHPTAAAQQRPGRCRGQRRLRGRGAGAPPPAAAVAGRGRPVCGAEAEAAQGAWAAGGPARVGWRWVVVAETAA
jgi:hypothetical protein